MKNSLYLSSVLTLAGVAFLTPSAAHAAAFQIKEKSAKAQGRAFAGSISAAGDAAVIADNPAAMRLLDGRLLQADLTAVDYAIKFDGAGNDALGRPLSGGNGGDAGRLAAVPAMYFHTPVGERMHVGLSVTAPFGFETEYGRNWAGRYHGIHTKIQAVDLGAAFAYDFNPQFSFGGSVFLERTQAKLFDSVDVGALLAASRVPGFAPASADAYTDIDAADNAFGYTLGVMFSPTEHTRIGLAYRSQVKHKLDDADIRFTVPANAASVLAAVRPGWFTNTQAATQLKFPASLTASVTHDLDERWTVMADIVHTDWSAFKEVKLDFASAQDDRTIDFGYRDATFLSLGTEYKQDDQLTLRAGVAYDQTPVRSEMREVRVPDVSRKWLALGATWRPSKALEYSVGYTHLFVRDPDVSLRSATGSSLHGTYDLNSNIIAVSVAYHF